MHILKKVFFNEKIRGKADEFLDGFGITLKDAFELKNIVFIKTRESELPIVEEYAPKTGQKFKVQVRSHSSQNAVYFFIDENAFEGFLKEDIENADLDLGLLMHEIGVIYGLEYNLNGAFCSGTANVWNALDSAFHSYVQHYWEPDTQEKKDFKDIVNEHFKDIVDELKKGKADLNENLRMRDYAGSKKNKKLKTIVDLRKEISKIWRKAGTMAFDPKMTKVYRRTMEAINDFGKSGVTFQVFDQKLQIEPGNFQISMNVLATLLYGYAEFEKVVELFEAHRAGIKKENVDRLKATVLFGKLGDTFKLSYDLMIFLDKALLEMYLIALAMDKNSINMYSKSDVPFLTFWAKHIYGENSGEAVLNYLYPTIQDKGEVLGKIASAFQQFYVHYSKNELYGKCTDKDLKDSKTTIEKYLQFQRNVLKFNGIAGYPMIMKQETLLAKIAVTENILNDLENHIKSKSDPDLAEKLNLRMVEDEKEANKIIEAAKNKAKIVQEKQITDRKIVRNEESSKRSPGRKSKEIKDRYDDEFKKRIDKNLEKMVQSNVRFQEYILKNHKEELRIFVNKLEKMMKGEITKVKSGVYSSILLDLGVNRKVHIKLLGDLLRESNRNYNKLSGRKLSWKKDKIREDRNFAAIASYALLKHLSFPKAEGPEKIVWNPQSHLQHLNWFMKNYKKFLEEDYWAEVITRIALADMDYKREEQIEWLKKTKGVQYGRTIKESNDPQKLISKWEKGDGSPGYKKLEEFDVAGVFALLALLKYKYEPDAIVRILRMLKWKLNNNGHNRVASRMLVEYGLFINEIHKKMEKAETEVFQSPQTTVHCLEPDEEEVEIKTVEENDTGLDELEEKAFRMSDSADAALKAHSRLIEMYNEMMKHRFHIYKKERTRQASKLMRSMGEIGDKTIDLCEKVLVVNESVRSLKIDEAQHSLGQMRDINIKFALLVKDMRKEIVVKIYDELLQKGILRDIKKSRDTLKDIVKANKKSVKSINALEFYFEDTVPSNLMKSKKISQVISRSTEGALYSLESIKEDVRSIQDKISVKVAEKLQANALQVLEEVGAVIDSLKVQIGEMKGYIRESEDQKRDIESVRSEQISANRAETAKSQQNREVKTSAESAASSSQSGENSSSEAAKAEAAAIGSGSGKGDEEESFLMGIADKIFEMFNENGSFKKVKEAVAEYAGDASYESFEKTFTELKNNGTFQKRIEELLTFDSMPHFIDNAWAEIKEIELQGKFDFFGQEEMKSFLIIDFIDAVNNDRFSPRFRNLLHVFNARLVFEKDYDKIIYFFTRSALIGASARNLIDRKFDKSKKIFEIYEKDIALDFNVDDEEEIIRKRRMISENDFIDEEVYSIMNNLGCGEYPLRTRQFCYMAFVILMLEDEIYLSMKKAEQLGNESSFYDLAANYIFMQDNKSEKWIKKVMGYKPGKLNSKDQRHLQGSKNLIEKYYGKPRGFDRFKNVFKTDDDTKYLKDYMEAVLFSFVENAYKQRKFKRTIELAEKYRFFEKNGVFAYDEENPREALLGKIRSMEKEATEQKKRISDQIDKWEKVKWEANAVIRTYGNGVSKKNGKYKETRKTIVGEAKKVSKIAGEMRKRFFHYLKISMLMDLKLLGHK